MSPSRKRSRDAHDINREVEVESASSSLRHNFAKRARVALAAENGGSVVSDDEDELDGFPSSGCHSEDDDRHSSAAGQSDSEDDDGEFDEIRASQIIEKQMREHRDNIASEQGVIEEVFCRNFMCHTKLRIKLGPLINFIIGHNGSGKSAVLTALTMCLGGKATTTNRGASLKSLIKEGEESATLAVKIKNRGDGAYKPELYGRTITVERHFSRSGTSGFKLKNSQDKTISTKRADLDDLLDFFAFQLDNPINVLTQDMARQFLSNSTPVDKYKFFIRGTQLETLDHDYKILEEHLDNMLIKMASRDDDVKVLAEKMVRAKAQVDRLEKAGGLLKKVRELQNQHAWAQVEEVEAKLEAASQKVQAAEQEVAEKEEEAEGISGTYDGHNQAYEASERTVTQLEEQLVPVKEQLEAEKENFSKARAELTDLNAQQRAIKEHTQASKKRMDTVEGLIQEERARIEGAEGEEHARRLKRLETLKTAAVEAKRKHEEHLAKRDEVMQRKNETGREHDATRGPLGQAKDELANAERQLTALQRSQGRPFDAYPRDMDQLVRAINNETRWRQKPVGPFGKHVRLLKPQWSSQIERTLGGVLNAFVVTNAEDQRMLRGIMRRFNLQELTIYLGDPQPLDTTDKIPDGGVDTVLSVLTIENDLVRNQLIINQSIEQMVLIPDRAEADAYFFHGPRPRNVRAVMAMAKEDPGVGIRMEFTRTGQPRTTTVHKWTGALRLQADREEQINHRRRIVDHHLRLFQQAEQRQQQAGKAMVEASQAIKRWENEERSLKTKVQEAEDEVEEQSNEIEANRPQDGKLHELERQLAEAKEEHDGYGQSYGDSVLQKDAASRKSADAKAVFDQAEREYNEGKRRIQQAHDRRSKLAFDRQQALMAKNTALNEIDSAKQAIRELQRKRDGAQETVDEWVKEAEKICRRIPVPAGMNAQTLDERIEKLNAQFREQERKAGGSADQLAVSYANAQHAHDEAKAAMDGLTNLKDKLVGTLSYRHFRWKEFRRYIAFRARWTFTYLLSERNFRGHVMMDHREKMLDIAVEPDLSRISDAGRKTTTLSGGEKSFSTICLLLSIWEAMGSPIRCLDEFDVFMDSVNRATSMNMMIQAARRAVGRQFILITPQSMNNVDRGDDVSIHKMSDPERGQGVLPFTQSA